MILLKCKRYLNLKLCNLMHVTIRKNRIYRMLFLIIITICIYFMFHFVLSYMKLDSSKTAFDCLSYDPKKLKEKQQLIQNRYNSILNQYIQPSSIELSLPKRYGITPKDAVWQTVHSTKFKFFIYSAFLDTRIESVGPLIRIIGAAKTNNPERVWCRLWYSNSSKTVSAFVQPIRENMNLKYSAVFVLCKLPPGENYPLSVSIVSHVQDIITNEMLIHIPNKSSEFKTDIEMCIKPFHSHYDTETRLMEFVEYYRLLGARHFTFYNGTVEPKVKCVLDQYKKDNLISVLPWHLDLVSKVNIRTEGLFAAFNDCLYRNMYNAKYIVFVDVDEMIVPKRNDTLLELINSIDLRLNNTPAVYLFQNAFFCMEWKDDQLSSLNKNQNESNLVVLHKIYHREVVHPHGVRSKFICDPRRVIEVGNHFVWEFLHGNSDRHYCVAPEVALLHHYRFCYKPPVIVEADPNSNLVVDRTIYKYKNKLVDRISNLRNGLNANCSIAQTSTNQT